MTMQSPLKKNRPQVKNQRLRAFVLGISLFFYYSISYALNWSITPTVQMQEVYSDNIKLSPPGSEKAAFVSSINPGVYATAQSGKTNLSLNYRLQNLYNAMGDSSFKSLNQLQYSASTALIPNKLFLNATSSITQQNLSPTSISTVSTDNISGSGNTSTVSTFNISPQWRPNFGHYASGVVSLNLNTVNSSKQQSSTTKSLVGSLSNFSNTNSVTETIQLNSGSFFKRVNWSVGLNNNENYRDSGNDVRFRSLNTTLKTYLNKNFSIIATIGESSNSFQGSGNNGFFYTIGGQWNPSKRYSVSAGLGNNSYVSFSLFPMQRLSWVTTLRDNSVGLNTGKTWQTALNYQTRRSMWSVSHNNDTTTTQALLLEQNTYNFCALPSGGIIPLEQNSPNTCSSYGGTKIIDSTSDQAFQMNIFLPLLTDQVIVRENWSFSNSFFMGKSVFTATASNEKRKYQATGGNDNVRSISGSWSWQMGRKTNFYLRSQWLQTDTNIIKNKPISSDRYDIAIGINRPISTHLNLNLEFRHIEQSYNTGEHNYQENRATASLFMRF